MISTLNPGGPKYNYFAYLKYTNDKLYTSGGGTNNTHIPPAIQILKDNEWNIYQNEGISDVTGMIDLLLNGGKLPAYADVNGDGKVSITDVTVLIDMLLNGN